MLNHERRSVASPPPADAALVLEGIANAFGGHVAIHACDFAVRNGESVGLLGASGCGKSTLLNIVVGFPLAARRGHPAGTSLR